MGGGGVDAGCEQPPDSIEADGIRTRNHRRDKPVL